MTSKTALILATTAAIALGGFEMRPAAAAPEGGRAIVKQNAGAERREEFLRLCNRDRVIETADDGHRGCRRRLSRARLVTEQIEVLHLRSDKRQAGVGTCAREITAQTLRFCHSSTRSARSNLIQWNFAMMMNVQALRLPRLRANRCVRRNPGERR